MLAFFLPTVCLIGPFSTLAVGPSSGFEFAGFGVILIPPEGLGGRDKGTVISSRRPKFVFLFAEAGCGEEKEG
jgi:hypothetical protein